jgi:hypothetical protein
MAGKRRIRAYTDEEVRILRGQKDLPPEEQQCPACAALGIRSYYTMFEGRAQPTIAYQMWCPACHTFTGSYGPALGRVVESDPVKNNPDAPPDGPSPEALDEFFSYLDRLWDQGLLPQRITRR